VARKKRPKRKGPDERVKFPFGETGSRDPLSDSDAPRSRRRKERIPSLPPDADPSDDADIDSLVGSGSVDLFGDSEDMTASDMASADLTDSDLADSDLDSDLGADSEDLFASGSSAEGAPLHPSSDPDLVQLRSGDMASISERIGPVNPSGPLVIVDDGDDASDSERFQASVVDDSARLAGSTSGRGKAPRKKRGGKRGGKRGESARKRSWREEQVDPDEDVPFPERRSRPRPAPPPRASKAPWLVAGLFLLAGAGGVGFLEHQRRADLAALKTAHEDALRAQREQAEADLAAQREAHARALADQEQRLGEASKRAAEEAAAAAAEEAAATERAAGRRALAEERARAERAAANAAEVELARAREDAEAQSADAIRAAVEEERARSEAALEEARAAAEAEKQEELDALRAEMERELAAAAASRRAEDELAESIAEDKSDMLDATEGGSGGSVSEGIDEGDDWDDFFDDGGSGGGGSGDGGGGGDDWDEFFEDDGGSDDADGDDEEGSGGNLLEQAWGWLRENFHGELYYKNLTHFDDGPNDDLRETRHEAHFKVAFKDWLIANDERSMGVRLVAAVDVMEDDDGFTKGVLDSVDEDAKLRPILTVDEGYLGLTLDWFELRGGWQQYRWGSGDLFNPTSNLNPIDYSDLFDPRRISVLSASAFVDFEAFSLTLVSIPTFTRTRLPLEDKRFDPLSGSLVPVLEPDDPEVIAENMQWAGRALVRVAGWDLSVSAFHGFDDLPSTRFILEDPDDPSTLAIDPVYERVTIGGFDFATTLGIFGAEGTLGEILGGIQLHGELAYTWSEGDFAEDFAQFVVGFSYQFVDLIFEHDVTLVLEFADDLVTREADNPLPDDAIDRALRAAVLARIQYEVNEDLSFAVNAAVITHGEENMLLHPSAEWALTDHVVLGVAGDVFLGPEETFFGQYRKDNRVILEAKLVF
jgi:hypothetical protein